MSNEHIADSRAYRTDSGDLIRQRLRETMPDEAYQQKRTQELHAHFRELIERYEMLDLKRRKRIGELDTRHTIVLPFDGARYVPAFQFGDDDQLKQAVIRINEEIAPDVSPWDAFQVWLAVHDWVPIMTTRIDGTFGRLRAIDLIATDAPYEMIEPLIFGEFNQFTP